MGGHRGTRGRDWGQHLTELGRGRVLQQLTHPFPLSAPGQVVMTIIVAFILEAFVFRMNYSRKNQDSEGLCEQPWPEPSHCSSAWLPGHLAVQSCCLAVQLSRLLAVQRVFLVYLLHLSCALIFKFLFFDFQTLVDGRRPRRIAEQRQAYCEHSSLLAVLSAVASASLITQSQWGSRLKGCECHTSGSSCSWVTAAPVMASRLPGCGALCVPILPDSPSEPLQTCSLFPNLSYQAI